MTYDERFEGMVWTADSAAAIAARVRVTADAVEAEGADGATYRVEHAACVLTRGGARGTLWSCQRPDRSVTIQSDAARFGRALRERAPAALASRADALERQTAAQRSSGRFKWGALLLGFGLFLAALVWGVQSAGPAALRAVPPSTDAQIGKLADASIAQQERQIEDPEVERALAQIVRRLAAAAGSRFDYHVRVIDAPEVNAFALPGGYLVVHSALIRAAVSGEQVAGVLAHEIAHVERRHGMQRIARSIGIAGAFQLLVGDVSGLSALLVQLVQQGAIHSYSRDQEREADRDGLHTLAKAGLDPRALPGFFRLLAQRERGSPAFASWLSSHPDLDERIATLDREARLLSSRAKDKYTSLGLDWAALQRRVASASRSNAPEPKPKPVAEPAAPLFMSDRSR